MSVKIRERKLKDGRISLMLDIYANGNREAKSLKIYLDANPNTPQKKAQNKEKKLKAEAIRARAEMDIIENDYSLTKMKKSNVMFLEYFKSIKETKRSSFGNYGNWDSAYKVLCSFFKNKDVRIADITDKDLISIREFIKSEYRTKSNTLLSQNASSSYFNKVRIVLNEAFEDNIVKNNIVKKVKAIKPGDTTREYLVKEEISKLEETECENPIIKNAFLFGVYSGLRFSDIVKLRWKDVRFTEASGYSIVFQQQKTGAFETLPIPTVAVKCLGEPQDAGEKIFKGLKYSAWTNLKLSQWIMKAGIQKHITFHSARHSYATYLLTEHVDIAVLSKMLGHKNLKTTMIYAKVVDTAKIDAVKVFDKK